MDQDGHLTVGAAPCLARINMAKSSTIEPYESSWAGGPTWSGLAEIPEVSEKMNEHLVFTDFYTMQNPYESVSVFYIYVQHKVKTKA